MKSHERTVPLLFLEVRIKSSWKIFNLRILRPHYFGSFREFMFAVFCIYAAPFVFFIPFREFLCSLHLLVENKFAI